MWKKMISKPNSEECRYAFIKQIVFDVCQALD